MGKMADEFNEYRERMNNVILSKDNLVLKRFWNLDGHTYEQGALDAKTKELLGLVASMVLRCDDCIRYHLGRSREQGVSTAEVYEVFAVANIVGGSIVIPHTRRAAAMPATRHVPAPPANTSWLRPDAVAVARGSTAMECTAAP